MKLNDVAAQKQDVLVIFPGRFQIFHKGHKKAYDTLVAKFGFNSVYIVTSDKVDDDKSPFNFAQKKKMMGLMGVNPSKIIKVKSPYKPKELTDKFDADNTILIYALGEKDKGRLDFKNYLKPFTTLFHNQPMSEHGYVISMPTVETYINGETYDSSSAIRDLLKNSKDKADQINIIKQLFGQYSGDVFNLISTTLELKESKVTEITSLSKYGKAVNSGALASHQQSRHEGWEFSNKKIDGLTVGVRRQFPAEQEIVLFDKNDSPVAVTGFKQEGTMTSVTIILVKVLSEYQGRGLGVKMYKFILQNLNQTIVSDETQSKGGQLLWKQLNDDPEVKVYGWKPSWGLGPHQGPGDDEFTNVHWDKVNNRLEGDQFGLYYNEADYKKIKNQLDNDFMELEMARSRKEFSSEEYKNRVMDLQKSYQGELDDKYLAKGPSVLLVATDDSTISESIVPDPFGHQIFKRRKQTAIAQYRKLQQVVQTLDDLNNEEPLDPEVKNLILKQVRHIRKNLSETITGDKLREDILNLSPGEIAALATAVGMAAPMIKKAIKLGYKTVKGLYKFKRTINKIMGEDTQKLTEKYSIFVSFNEGTKKMKKRKLPKRRDTTAQSLKQFRPHTTGNAKKELSRTASRQKIDLEERVGLHRPHPSTTLDFSRDSMPQIKTDDYPELLQFMKMNGVAIKKTSVLARTLKPVQSEYSDDKVDMDSTIYVPLLISNDNYIVDGHHRWLAAMNQSPNRTVPVFQFGLPIEKLIEVLMDFPKIIFKDIYEGE